MNRTASSKGHRGRKKVSQKESGRIKSGPGEDFNTGSHSPSSLLNVSAGYDDTGMGSESKVPDRKNKTAHKQNKKRRNAERTRRTRSRSKNLN